MLPFKEKAKQFWLILGRRTSLRFGTAFAGGIEARSPLTASRCRTAFTKKSYDEFESKMHDVSPRGRHSNGAVS